MDKEKAKKWLKEFGYALLQVVFSRITFFGFVSPVGLPFAFARIFFGGNIFVSTIGYFISKIYAFSSFNVLISTIYEVVILALFYFAIEFFKTKHKILMLYGFLVISNAVSLYFNMFNLTLLWHFAVNFLVEAVLVFYFYMLFRIYKNKFIFFKFSRRDYFYFSILILFLSVGIFEYKFLLDFFGIFILSSLVVFLAKVLPVDKYFISVCLFALGACIASENYLYLVFFVIACLVIFQAKDFSKILYSAVCLAVMLTLSLLFRMFDALTLVSLALPAIVFLCLPTRLFVKASSLFEIENKDILTHYLEENKTKQIQGKLLLMSASLTSMQNGFKYLLIGKIDRVKASKELAGDIIQKCCGNCEHYKSCFLGNIDKKTLIDSLLFKAIEKSGLGGSDLTNGTIAYCSKNQIMLSEINQTARLFLSYEQSVKKEDESKLMVAGEIRNFANIFQNFAKIVENSSKINEKLSKTLKEALLNRMIDVKEVAISETDFGIKSIDLVLTNEQALRREIPEAIFSITKLNTKMKKPKHMEFSGICLVTFEPVAKIKPEFCVSSRSKEGKNGDTAAITKLSENKYFVAISDGMGHGENANKLSSMVLSIIRSLFEVGLDETLITNSINQLLLPVGLDGFATLDACVLDLDKNLCTFIKLGSSVSVIKHRDTSEVIACASLPIGIVQNVTPTISTKPISAGDMIFIASDGVVDSFQSIEIYKSFINDAKIFNLQKYLDEVVFDANYQNKLHPDDMTIIGINLLKNQKK